MCLAEKPVVLPFARPWYRRGGMHLHEQFSAVLILGPWLLMATPLLEKKMALVAMVLALATLIRVGLKTSDGRFFPAFVLPLYLTGVLHVAQLPIPMWSMPLLVLGSSVLGIAKIGICMSVCLHRYAGHAAFRCHWLTSLALGWLGCLANQGGPIWWGSTHRVHHKFCDGERDPHSAIVTSPAKAFSFFEDDANKYVHEEFAPNHIDFPAMRVLDTFAALPHAVEQYLAYSLFGPTGLYVAWLSGAFCQAITLWFNIMNHPPNPDGPSCKATNCIGGVAPNFMLGLLQSIVVFGKFGAIVGESGHLHHHDHAMLARRPGPDLPYFLFVKPLVALGVLWSPQLLTKYE